MLVKDVDGKYWNSKDIAWASCVRREKFRYEYVCETEDRLFVLSASEFHKIIRSCTLIPAQPGFFLLRAWFDPEEKTASVDRYPIVGWEVSDDGIHSPVCVGFWQHLKDQDESDQYYLVPDGRVFAYETEYEDEEAYKADFISKRMKT